jgi:hypothetical protein
MPDVKLSRGSDALLKRTGLFDGNSLSGSTGGEAREQAELRECRKDQGQGELELSHESIPRVLLLLLGQLEWLHCCAPVQGGRRR